MTYSPTFFSKIEKAFGDRMPVIIEQTMSVYPDGETVNVMENFFSWNDFKPDVLTLCAWRVTWKTQNKTL